MNESHQPEGVTGSEPEEVKDEQPAARKPDASHPTPLFLRDGNDGMKGDAQDEKDETAE